MDLLVRFRDYIQQNGLFQQKDHLLLAVSGGVDSVVLCELCKLSGFDFTIAHCNFQLRGKESRRDEDFVSSLAKKYEVPFITKRFDTVACSAEKKISIQEAARELRYSWFAEIITNTSKPTMVLTAHHLDDNIETMLMNLFRGTGIAGLRGILPKHGNICRPLLFARKEELLQFAASHQLQWVEDSSNLTDKYSRNYLRHQLIPVIEQIYPGVVENLASSIERFSQIETVYEEAVRYRLKKLVEQKGDDIRIPVLKLKKMGVTGTILFELIRQYGFTTAQLKHAVHLLEAASGKFITSGTHRLLKDRDWLILSPISTTLQQEIMIEVKEGSVLFADGKLDWKLVPVSKVDTPFKNGDDVAMIDLKDIEFPMMLRKWRPGDYFYPLGMKKKKKLARFFIDQKLSLAEKEKAWVLESNRRIVWVVGRRIDDRFRITTSTRNVLKFTFHQKC